MESGRDGDSEALRSLIEPTMLSDLDVSRASPIFLAVEAHNFLD